MNRIAGAAAVGLALVMAFSIWRSNPIPLPLAPAVPGAVQSIALPPAYVQPTQVRIVPVFPTDRPDDYTPIYATAQPTAQPVEPRPTTEAEITQWQPAPEPERDDFVWSYYQNGAEWCVNVTWRDTSPDPRAGTGQTACGPDTLSPDTQLFVVQMMLDGRLAPGAGVPRG